MFQAMEQPDDSVLMVAPVFKLLHLMHSVKTLPSTFFEHALFFSNYICTHIMTFRIYQ